MKRAILILAAMAMAALFGSVRPAMAGESRSPIILCEAGPEQQGCCSWHQGVCGCTDGRTSCCDGTLSPSCGCHSDDPLAEAGLPGFLLVRGDGYSSSHSSFRSSSVHVRGYTQKNGTYVAPHFRSAPDHSKLNNWSTKGNVNPYTGKEGTKNP